LRDLPGRMVILALAMRAAFQHFGIAQDFRGVEVRDWKEAAVTQAKPRALSDNLRAGEMGRNNALISSKHIRITYALLRGRRAEILFPSCRDQAALAKRRSAAPA
jgi:hypothetical protein